MNGFVHSFISEVMSICRAHVAALGGNALFAYQMSECVLETNTHKNQVSVTSRSQKGIGTSLGILRT